MITGKTQAWLRLFRPPNLFTVPGDVLAGAFLAAHGAVAGSGAAVFAALGAGFCLYGAGLLLNDWADVSVDARERPERPLPSGLVGRKTVLLLALLLTGGGLGFARLAGSEVLTVGILLAGAVANYNLLTKSIPLVGALNMGLCRALHLLLGAVAVGSFALEPLVLGAAGGVFLYITAVTHIARREMSGRYALLERWLPAMALAAIFFFCLPFSPVVHWPGQVAFLLLMGLAVGLAGRVAVLLPGRVPAVPPVAVPPLVGRLIGVLVILQSAFIFISGDGPSVLWTGVAILALWPLQRGLGKLFYSS